jgi:hypothetical protein
VNSIWQQLLAREKIYQTYSPRGSFILHFWYLAVHAWLMTHHFFVVIFSFFPRSWPIFMKRSTDSLLHLQFGCYKLQMSFYRNRGSGLDPEEREMLQSWSSFIP